MRPEGCPCCGGFEVERRERGDGKGSGEVRTQGGGNEVRAQGSGSKARAKGGSELRAQGMGRWERGESTGQ